MFYLFLFRSIPWLLQVSRGNAPLICAHSILIHLSTFHININKQRNIALALKLIVGMPITILLLYKKTGNYLARNKVETPSYEVWVMVQWHLPLPISNIDAFQEGFKTIFICFSFKINSFVFPYCPSDILILAKKICIMTTNCHNLTLA